MAKKTEQEQTLDLGDVEEKNPPRVEKKSAAKAEKSDSKSPAQLKKLNLDKKPLLIIIFILCVLLGYNTYEVQRLKHVVDHTFVYDIEAVLMQTGLADENRKFEANMAELENEIDKAEKKVNSMKDKKLQEEYREMYMKSLTLKRDNLVEEHEKFMKSLLKNINKTLAEVAKKHHVKVIFNNKAVVFSTKYVTNITPLVAAKLKEKMEE